MLTIPRVENDIEKVNQFRALAHKAGSDAVRLRIVERFLCEVDRWLLKLSPPLFDVTLIKNSIHSLKSGGMDDDASILLEAEFQLQREFQLWRQLIEAKDRNIETYNFRRFCDSSAQPLDSEIFVALATFYRETPYSQINQSKFDLVITRLFTDVDAAGQRHLRFNPTEIARRAMQFQTGTEAKGDRSDRFLDRAGAVAAIHSFIAEAHGLDDFESLIECGLFDRYREFKRELGEQFYEPEILAAAIQCNVVFSNAFNEMLEAANDNLSEILRPEIDISAALHDPSPEARVHLSDLLNEFFDIDPATSARQKGSEGDHIWELLSLAGAKTGMVDEHADPLTESPRPDFDVSQSARERLTPFLETLLKPEPDAGLLLGQLNRSRSLRTLNLSDFLYGENYAADMRSRQILGLILWLEEFVQHELGTQKTLTPTGQQEILSLIQKTEELATNLRSEIQAAGEGSKGRLLVVLNTLLESRLRLEGAIVKFTSRNLSQSQSPKVEVRERKPAAVRAITDTVPFQVESRPKTRWLPWLLLLGALLAAAYFFYQKNIPAPIPNGSSMVQVESSSLPNREYIRAAYRRDSILFVTADETWASLPSDKQKAFLKGLLESRQDTPIDNVVLRDAAGHLLGNASVNGIYVPQQAPADTGNKPN